MEMDRRKALGAMAGFALMMAEASGAKAQDAGAALTECAAFHYDKLAAKPSSNGGDSRAVTEGNLATGEHVEMHMTTLPVGKMPHPPHKHKNSEFVMIREGQIEYLTDGHAERVGPGDVLFTASMKPHGMRNVGTVTARYFVVSVGEKVGQVPVELKPVVG
jgi:uncharacterized cupin superfamily protein